MVMSIRGNIAVRLISETRDEHVTLDASNLRYSKRAPGGHFDVSFTLNAALGKWADLNQNDRIELYDTRLGITLWSGYVLSATPTKGTYGETFDVKGIGGVALFADRSEKLPYLTRDTTTWKVEDQLVQVAGASVSVGGDYPDGTRKGIQAVWMQFPNGQVLVTGSQVGARCHQFADSIMVPGAFLGNYVAGMVSTNARLRLYGDTSGGGVPHQLADISLSTTENHFEWYADPTSSGVPASDEWPYDTAEVAVALYWNGGAATIANDTTWVGVDPPVVMAQLLDVDGVRRDMSGLGNYGTHTPAQTAWLYVHDVVADLVGRLMPFVDPDRVSIATTTYEIDQLSFDATTIAGVFDTLRKFEPDSYHWIGTTGADGRHEFSLLEWGDGTNPRYVLNKLEDGYVEPGGEVNLSNRMAVHWTDEKGVTRPKYVGADVPELGNGDPVALGSSFVGRIIDAQPLQLDDGVSSEANATQIATALLAQANAGTAAGQALVRRPIWDHWLHRFVMPWEMEPGCYVIVSETQETHRLTVTDYNDNDCSTTCTLGDPVLTEEELVAQDNLRGRIAARQVRR